MPGSRGSALFARVDRPGVSEERLTLGTRLSFQDRFMGRHIASGFSYSALTPIGYVGRFNLSRTAESVGTMLDVLGVFKRNINQLFGTCVDILNVGRSLQQLSLSMQILAINGVVQAAKVGGGKGRPMLALVEILNHTPREIRPEVDVIEHRCADLARLTAHSSSIVWRYYQLINGLLLAMPRGHRFSSRTDAEVFPSLRFTTPDDITTLMTHQSFRHGESLEQDNLRTIGRICQINLTDLHERLRQTLHCLEEISRALHGLEMIGLTARYMAFCIASEAAALDDAGLNFKNLSTEIGRAVDDLEAKTHTMKVSIESGQELVESLLEGHVHAE